MKIKKEVECPYCYAVYDVNVCWEDFVCVGCESILHVEYDEDGEPYIDEQ